MFVCLFTSPTFVFCVSCCFCMEILNNNGAEQLQFASFSRVVGRAGEKETIGKALKKGNDSEVEEGKGI